MRASLVYLDRHTGDLMERHEMKPDYSRLSIRHMALDQGGSVWFGCQHEGNPVENPPIIGRHRQGGQISLLEQSVDIGPQFRSYVGSVAASSDGSRIATTSPRGGAIAIWNGQTTKLEKVISLQNVSGIAEGSGNGFLASGGQGHMLETRRGVPFATSHGWDNHLVRVR